MIAVDPHQVGNTAAVLDPVAKTLIESARFANTADGYVQLAGFAARWEQRRRAVEGCFALLGLRQPRAGQGDLGVRSARRRGRPFPGRR